MNVKIPLTLKPQCLQDNALFGKNKDGGYLLKLQAVVASTYMVGGGVATSWDFELDIKKLNKAISIDLFDHTISPQLFLLKSIEYRDLSLFKACIKMLRDFYWKKQIKIHYKKIEPKSYFSSLLQREKSIVKIDIEGDEYDILDELMLYQKNMNILIIEFHDVREHIEVIQNFNNCLKENLYITYVNANNYSSVENNLPSYLEIVWTNNQFKDLPSFQIANNPNKDYLKVDFI